MSATVIIDQTEHTLTVHTIFGSFREGGTRYVAECSCGQWRGTPVAGLGNETAQWNAHVRTGER